jgi:poly(A) polymerase
VSLEDALAAGPVRAVRDALGADAGRAWVVGGAVRDALLGREVRDVDLAVAGDPEPVARAVARAIDGPVFPLSREFGAWRAIARREGYVVDVSPLQGATVEEDLALRDFTVNAMAVPLAGGEPVDPHGGAGDLDARLLRVLPHAYDADPLRPMRLARLAAELGLTPDPDTERLTADAAPRVMDASPERVFAELRRLLVADGVVEGMELADRLGLLAAALPEVAELHGVEQSRYHHLDVFDHTLEVLRRQVEVESRLGELFGEHASAVEALMDEPLADELTRGQALRFGALLHDVAKPATRAVLEDGRVTFLGHDSAGEEMVSTIFRRLRSSERLARFVGALTRHHLVLGFLVHDRPLSRRDVYRYLHRTTPVEVEVTLLSVADRLATRGRNAERAIAAHLELAAELMPAALAWREHGPPRAPLRGDELAAELDIEEGPEIGRLLARLREAAYAEESFTKEQALELARRVRET